jgi:hypothetical protein
MKKKDLAGQPSSFDGQVEKKGLTGQPSSFDGQKDGDNPLSSSLSHHRRRSLSSLGIPLNQFRAEVAEDVATLRSKQQTKAKARETESRGLSQRAGLSQDDLKSGKLRIHDGIVYKEDEVPTHTNGSDYSKFKWKRGEMILIEDKKEIKAKVYIIPILGGDGHKIIGILKSTENPYAKSETSYNERKPPFAGGTPQLVGGNIEKADRDAIVEKGIRDIFYAALSREAHEETCGSLVIGNELGLLQTHLHGKTRMSVYSSEEASMVEPNPRPSLPEKASKEAKRLFILDIDKLIDDHKLTEHLSNLDHIKKTIAVHISQQENDESSPDLNDENAWRRNGLYGQPQWKDYYQTSMTAHVLAMYVQQCAHEKAGKIYTYQQGDTPIGTPESSRFPTPASSRLTTPESSRSPSPRLSSRSPYGSPSRSPLRLSEAFSPFDRLQTDVSSSHLSPHGLFPSQPSTSRKRHRDEHSDIPSSKQPGDEHSDIPSSKRAKKRD